MLSDFPNYHIREAFRWLHAVKCDRNCWRWILGTRALRRAWRILCCSGWGWMRSSSIGRFTRSFFTYLKTSLVTSRWIYFCLIWFISIRLRIRIHFLSLWLISNSIIRLVFWFHIWIVSFSCWGKDFHPVKVCFCTILVKKLRSRNLSHMKNGYVGELI